MRTTIKQQMKVVKALMKQVEQNGKYSGKSLKEIHNSLHWRSLNDAYSSLASIALVDSMRSASQLKPSALM